MQRIYSARHPTEAHLLADFLEAEGIPAARRLLGLLEGIVRYRERIPFWQYPAIVIILILYAVVVSSLMPPVGAYLRGSVLSFLPVWFLNPSQESLERLHSLST